MSAPRIPDPARRSTRPVVTVDPARVPFCPLSDRDPEYGDCGECVHSPASAEFYAYDFDTDEDEGTDLVERFGWGWAA